MEHTPESVAKRAGVPVVHRNTLRLVRFEDCTAFLREARAEGAVVLGVEGFRVAPDSVMPLMDAITEFSNIESSEETIAATERFLASVGAPGMWFDFALGRGLSAGDIDEH